MRAATVALLLVSSAIHASVPVASLTPLPAERDTHGSAVVGSSLYVIGGAETTAWKPTASVLRAPIREDLTIGQWAPVTPLPKKVLFIGTSVVAQADVLYVVGGQERVDDQPGEKGEKVVRSTALYTKVAPDGSLGEWLETQPWGSGAGVACAAAVNGRTLYASGGRGEGWGNPDNRTFFAPLGPAGEPGAWVETSPLPVGLWFHQMVLHGETAFVLSGRSTSKGDGQNLLVYRSRINADGSLQPWEALPDKNPSSTFQGAYAATNNFVFGVGGKDRNWFSSESLIYGTVSPDGIGDWQTIKSPGFKVERMAATASGRFGALYLTGGRTAAESTGMTAACFVVKLKRDAEFAVKLPPGFDCLLPYEEALTAIRSTGQQMLLVTVAGGSPQSAAFAQSLCAMPANAQIQRAYLNLGQSPELARKLGLVQPGLLATIDAHERVLQQNREAYSPTLE
jgi:hypothetical protein